MIKENERLLSLDLFRGGVIAGFIIQNNPGSNAHMYSQLIHAQWNGCTVADLGFPFFLFIMGVGISFSLEKLVQNGAPKSAIYQKILIRSCTLFIVGIFFENIVLLFDPAHYSWENFASFRLMGTFQRIGLTYLIASAIIIEFKKFKPILICTAAVIGGYWLAMMTIPVPGHGAGDLSKYGNLATYVDKLLIPYNLPQNDGFDALGLLSTIPATASVLIGCLTGFLFQSEKSYVEKFTRLISWGILCVLLGLIIDIWFPINKSIWSSSYVLFTGGLALLILGMVYFIVEIKDYTYWNWTKPFEVFGLNCLIIFLISSLFTRLIRDGGVPVPDGGTAPVPLIFYYHVFLPVMPPNLASFTYALLYLVFWMGIAIYLQRKDVFI